MSDEGLHCISGPDQLRSPFSGHSPAEIARLDSTCLVPQTWPVVLTPGSYRRQARAPPSLTASSGSSGVKLVLLLQSVDTDGDSATLPERRGVDTDEGRSFPRARPQAIVNVDAH